MFKKVSGTVVFGLMLVTGMFLIFYFSYNRQSINDYRIYEQVFIQDNYVDTITHTPVYLISITNGCIPAIKQYTLQIDSVGNIKDLCKIRREAEKYIENLNNSKDCK